MFYFRLDEISGAASKEFGLEKAMEKMKVEWKDMYFEFIPYRDTVSRRCISSVVTFPLQLKRCVVFWR